MSEGKNLKGSANCPNSKFGTWVPLHRYWDPLTCGLKINFLLNINQLLIILIQVFSLLYNPAHVNIKTILTLKLAGGIISNFVNVI